MNDSRRKVMAATVAIAAATATSAEAAYYYEAATTVQGAGAGDGVSTVRAWVDGTNARVEFGETSGPFPSGSYLLSNDGGETLYVVNPAERTISEIDLAQIFQMVGSLADATGGMVKIEFADFTTEKLGEEAGEKILGYTTTHHRFKTGYTMRLKVLGMTRENRTDTEQDLWCTDEVDAAAFDVWLRPDRFRTGNEDMDRLIEQQYASVDCLPLRNRMVSTIEGQTSTTTTEVTALREEAAPANAFVLPADFTTAPLIPAIPGLEGEGDEAQPAEDQPRRPRLRDLIGR